MKPSSHPLVCIVRLQLAAAAHLEAAMLEHAFSRVLPAEAALRAAAAAAGIRVELTGAPAL